MPKQTSRPKAVELKSLPGPSGRTRDAAKRNLVDEMFVPQSAAPTLLFDSTVNVPTVPKCGTVRAFEAVFAPTVPLFGTVSALKGFILYGPASDARH